MESIRLNMQNHKTLVGQKLKINKDDFGCPPENRFTARA
jgi:hypothetical protein